mmetsp:Transcript_31689/g.30977  ORF Transcript_31689/g.30977 Transcript_31689/m.30977 type:complete len:92 (-) Transcript_31689:179-454(-)
MLLLYIIQSLIDPVLAKSPQRLLFFGRSSLLVEVGVGERHDLSEVIERLVALFEGLPLTLLQLHPLLLQLLELLQRVLLDLTPYNPEVVGD